VTHVSEPWTGWDPPAGTQGWSDFHWWKVSPGRILKLIILSSQPMGYSGHFVKGRMAPCYGEECQECRRGTGNQLRYLLAAAESETRRAGIWDIGRSIALEIRDLAQPHGPLRGTLLEISHVSHSKQSRTSLNYIPWTPPRWIDDIDTPDVLRALVETWRKAGFEIPHGFDRSTSPAAETRSVRAMVAAAFRTP